MPYENDVWENHSSQVNKFANVYLAAQRIEQDWQQLSQSIINAPSGVYNKQFRELNISFKQALQQLQDELLNPTLILATTGTTSSGKSTIVNLLCGADIMPRMSQEMSAGIVTIKHAPDGTAVLKIHKTSRAAWSCGEWRNLSDAEIQARLTSTMNQFNALRGDNQPESPRIELTYPIACFREDSPLQLSGLPQSTRFQILDLPGLRNLRDESNSQVIRNHCKEALCLVAYNCEEVDPDKQRNLVEQVIEQVKEMGGSPVRMLFILNRIDAFNRDPNAGEATKVYMKKIRRQITESLNARLPEYRDTTGTLTYTRLSSLPALYALQLKNEENRINAAEELDSHFNYLIPKAILDDLSRNTNRWQDHDFTKVSQAVWETSYANEFHDSLRQHIESHFATLVIPPSVYRFINVVENAIGEASRTCYSELNASREKYEAATQELYEKDAYLKQFLAKSSNNLIDPFAKLAANSNKKKHDIAFALEVTTEELIATYRGNLTSAQLSPLYLWQNELVFWVKSSLQGAWQSIKAERKNFSQTKAEDLPEHLQNALYQACESLLCSEFSKIEKGKVRKLNDDEKKRADDIQLALKNFSESIAEIIADILEIRSQRELSRIHATLETVLHLHLDEVRTGVKKIAPEWGINIGRNLLDDIPLPELTPPKLTIETSTRSVEERNPWRLWITKRIVSYDYIPNIDEIMEQWELSLQTQIDELLQPFLDSLLNSMKILCKKVDQTKDTVLQDAHYKLDEAHRRHQSKLENHEDYWQPLALQAEKSSQNINGLLVMVKTNEQH